MCRFMLKSKIIWSATTGTDVDYEDSVIWNEELLERADILPAEQVHAFNIIKRGPFVTYAMVVPQESELVVLHARGPFTE